MLFHLHIICGCFALQWQSWIVVTEKVCPTRPKMLVDSLLQKQANKNCRHRLKVIWGNVSPLWNDWRWWWSPNISAFLLWGTARLLPSGLSVKYYMLYDKLWNIKNCSPLYPPLLLGIIRPLPSIQFSPNGIFQSPIFPRWTKKI